MPDHSASPGATNRSNRGGRRPTQVRAGGRIPLIVGKGLTNKARASLGLGATEVFVLPEQVGAA